MAELADKVGLSLDEDRMLVLVVQVLIGFQFRGAFEAGFDRLPPAAQYVKLTSFGLLLITLAMLLTVPPYHRMVEQGDNTVGFATLVTRLIGCALLPFAVALGCDVGLVSGHLFGTSGGLLAGIVTALTAVFFWYGVQIIARYKGYGRSSMKQEKPAKTSLTDKIKQILTEARIILPGAQALLGFQLSGVFTDAFEKLEPSSKLIHFVALTCVALAVILLMTPPAYHRIVEKGEDTDRFHRIANRFVISAMVPLALGITSDFYVVVQKVMHSSAISAAIAGAMLLLFYGCWFLYPWSQSGGRGRSAALAAARSS